MGFTKITNADMNGKGAMSLPNQPTISAPELKRKFDEPAKEVVTPKFNNLIDELEAETSAANLGASAPTGRVGTTVQGVLNSISSDLTSTQAVSHSHDNKACIDKFADDGTGLTYDGDPISGAIDSVNGQTGTVVLTASDVGALPDTTVIPTKTSDLTNDSGFVTSSDVPTKTSDLTNDSGFVTASDVPTKTSDLTNDSNFVADASYVHTDNNYDATAKGIVDGATAAIAAKSTVAWSQIITTGQKIATVSIDGTPTDVYAPTGGGGGGGAVDSVNGQTGIVVLNQADLNDVTITGVAANDALVYDSGWKNKSLADVALSGSYNDLDDKPTIPSAQVNSDWNASTGVAQILNKPNLATVATSGSYNDLSNKPTIPAAQVNSDWNASSGVAEILNKPTIPTVDQTYSSSSTNAQSGTAVASAISGKANSSDLDGWSALAYTNSSGVVAFSLNDSNDYDYDIYCDITPPLDFTAKLSSVTGKGTASCTITYQTTGLPTNTTCKLRILK